MRNSGMLMHISSLPGNYGIGSLGKEAYAFVDFLKKSGIEIWQVLPITPTGFGDSPYQSVSSFAGNPYFIDLDMLVSDGILNSEDLPSCEYSPERVDYGKLFEERPATLYKAFEKSYAALESKINDFRSVNAWVDDYALFSAVKKHFGLRSWMEWEDESIRLREDSALQKYSKLLEKEINYYVFVQYLFFEQWFKLKKYANDSGIKFFGDMPIYAAEDSADVWKNPEVFQLDEKRRPYKVAGVPPDYFSADGQRWGNPLYNWEYLQRNGYSWWLNRLSAMGKIYDIVRVDHFIGFANYYSIPASEQTARIGEWIDAPGLDFFKTVKEKMPNLCVVAEDLGAVNEKVLRLLDFCDYPGMKIAAFGLNADPKNDHNPYNYRENCVAYTGTHDNSTLLGFVKAMGDYDREVAFRILNISDINEYVPALIKLTMMSKAKHCIIPMQDWLCLDDSARMNMPGTLGGINWQWRVNKESLNEELSQKILALSMLSGRTRV